MCVCVTLTLYYTTSFQSLHGGIDELKMSKADKQQLEVEVREVHCKMQNDTHQLWYMTIIVCLHSQKADRTALDSKASREWVDSTFERLDREIREAKTRYLGQEEALKSAMHQINEDVEGKLDRMELEPLKEYFGELTLQ